MPRLIDVDAFKIEFCEKCNNVLCDAPLTSTDCFIMYMLDNTPTIEAEPVRHGRWEECGQCDIYDYYKCSECGYFSFDEETNYCPYCGAKLDGGEKE